VRAALANLHAAHAIVLTPAGDAVRMAHPFSAAPMGSPPHVEAWAKTGPHPVGQVVSSAALWRLAQP